MQVVEWLIDWVLNSSTPAKSHISGRLKDMQVTKWLIDQALNTNNSTTLNKISHIGQTYRHVSR